MNPGNLLRFGTLRIIEERRSSITVLSIHRNTIKCTCISSNVRLIFTGGTRESKELNIITQRFGHSIQIPITAREK